MLYMSLQAIGERRITNYSGVGISIGEWQPMTLVSLASSIPPVRKDLQQDLVHRRAPAL
jgi:hypothetical protein